MIMMQSKRFKLKLKIRLKSQLLRIPIVTMMFSFQVRSLHWLKQMRKWP